jgi:hypothetical protein
LFAYQNEGESWKPVAVDVNGSVSFQATPKLAIAFSYSPDQVATADVIYASRDELAPLNGQTCPSQRADSVSGTVANAERGTASIRLGQSFASSSGPFKLVAPAVSTDLVAFRYFNTPSTSVDRMIIRRSVNAAPGSVIPTLDFASSEAFAPVTVTLTVTGLSAMPLMGATFLPANPGGSRLKVLGHLDRPSANLFPPTLDASGVATIAAVPTARTVEGDVHRVWVIQSGLGLSRRGVFHFFRNSGNQTLSLGADLSAVTVTTISATPVLRMRASLDSQSDYSSFVVASFFQTGCNGCRRVDVVMTRGWFGGTPPAKWALDVPDLSPVGLGSAFGLASDATTWEVEAHSGSLATYLGRRPADGEVDRYASTHDPVIR